MNIDTENTIKPAAENLIEGELINLRTVGAVVKRIRLLAQRELEQAKKMRVEAEQYQKGIEAKANSQAQLFLLRTRLMAQKEVKEIRRKASEELKEETADFLRRAYEKLEQEIVAFKQKAGQELEKALADIRVIRIAAHEELQAQRKLTDAARIQALSFELGEEDKQSSGCAEQTTELQELSHRAHG